MPSGYCNWSPMGHLYTYCKHGWIHAIIRCTAPQWESGFEGACRGGHREIIELVINRDITNRNNGLCYAARGDHRDIIDLFIAMGIGNLNSALYGAARGGHRATIDLLISYGANDWDNVLAGACIKSNYELIDLAIANGATDWETCLEIAFYPEQYAAARAARQKIEAARRARYGPSRPAILHKWSDSDDDPSGWA